jgi:hypothetical protein
MAVKKAVTKKAAPKTVAKPKTVAPVKKTYETVKSNRHPKR